MRTLCLLSTLSLGCAASVPVTSTLPSEDAARAERLAELEAAVREREQEVRELRSRLALAQAEAEELRRRQQPAPGETVRIRSRGSDEDGLLFFDEEGDDQGWEVPAEELPQDETSDARRPTLRLYGSPAVGLPDAALRAPDLPSASLPANPLAALPRRADGWNTTPVTAVPAPAYVPPAPAAPARPVVDAQYRAGLGALRARRFEEALGIFDAFLQRAPTHPQAANARYWRAEVLYILRRYREARTAFEAYLRAHGSGRKAPDALYKLALCHRRLGDETGARRALERLRRSHPNSVAARMASREAS